MRGPPPARPQRPQVIANFLKVEGLTVKYVGPGQDDSQAAAVRSDNPVPPDVPLFYFEVLIVNKGAEGYIGEPGNSTHLNALCNRRCCLELFPKLSC